MSNLGSISIKRTPEQVALIKKMGSKNKAEAAAAQEAFANFIGDVILVVVETAPVISNLYTNKPYTENTAPSLPLDVLWDVRNAGYLQVWTQTIAGGLPTNFVHGLDELMVSTYDLLSAVSFGKKWAREARLDVVAAVMERMAQEILVKQEYNGASIMLNAAATAVQQGTGNYQVIRSNTQGQVSMGDFNRWNTLMARSRPSWVGGSPVGNNFLTDIAGSPEFMEQIRALAYQPVNTYAGSVATQGATALAAPENIRQEVWKTAGLTTFFGTNLTNVFLMGINKTSPTIPNYNDLFGQWAGANAYQGYGQSGTAVFSPTTEEVTVGLNLSNPNVLVRLVQETEGGGRLTVSPSDEYPLRVDKLGFVAGVTEGRAMLDQRSVSSLVW